MYSFKKVNCITLCLDTIQRHKNNHMYTSENKNISQFTRVKRQQEKNASLRALVK